MAEQTTTREGLIADRGLTSMELATIPVEERNLRGLELAERIFSPEQRTQIAAMLTVPAESPALLPYLALCVSEGFSPWANHVWLIPKTIKAKSKDGSADTEEKKWLPAVGRDGLLHKARQTQQSRSVGAFRGLRHNVVCERDTFEVEDDGETVKVLHRFASKPTVFAPDVSPDRYRGRVIGAWALLRQEGLPPTFYYANLREHGKLRHVWEWNAEQRKRQPLYHAPEGGVTFSAMSKVRQGDREVTVRNRPVQDWEGAWDYLSSMILKAAQSYVLRIGMGVTGFVPVDELRSVEEWQADTGPAQASSAVPEVAEFDFDVLDAPEETRERLRAAVADANRMEPFSWAPAKCEMVFHGRSATDLLGYVQRIEEENELRVRRVEEREAAAEEAEPVDAEVVDEKPPADSAGDRIAVLRHRESELSARIDGADPGSEEAGELSLELDGVQEELRQLAGENPEQGDLGV